MPQRPRPAHARAALLLALFASGAASAARAHSPYLLPNAFDATGRDHVTVQAAFTERFFTPEIAMRSDGWAAVGPDGARTPLQPTYLDDVTLLRAPLAGEGTWRITSGVRAGRVAKAALVKGEWVFLQEGRPAPAGAAPVDMQSVTCAETYVSRGKPGDAALAPTGRGLEFHALTHPDRIAAGEPARFEVLMDGRPVPGQPIALHRADEAYAEGADAASVQVVSDAAGRFTLTPPTPGVYLAMTRLRRPPEGAGPAHSHTYALTFEAVR